MCFFISATLFTILLIFVTANFLGTWQDFANSENENRVTSAQKHDIFGDRRRFQLVT